MGFFLFLGRVFFASLIIVSAWQMFNGFGVDGGPAAKEWSLKLNLAKANLSYRLWVNLPNIEVRQGSVTVVSLIAIGGVIFVIRKIFGAYLRPQSNVSCGCVQSRHWAVYFTVVSPILYDIYNNGPEDRYFSPFWIELLKNVASFGAMYTYFLNE
ncbi:HR-like lesion-inducing protein-related [Raphanus sativus]|nr:HR-like lesion-inducing protein-related [Raphanus sativus]